MPKLLLKRIGSSRVLHVRSLRSALQGCVHGSPPMGATSTAASGRTIQGYKQNHKRSTQKVRHARDRQQRQRMRLQSRDSH